MALLDEIKTIQEWVKFFLSVDGTFEGRRAIQGADLNEFAVSFVDIPLHDYGVTPDRFRDELWNLEEERKSTLFFINDMMSNLLWDNIGVEHLSDRKSAEQWRVLLTTKIPELRIVRNIRLSQFIKYLLVIREIVHEIQDERQRKEWIVFLEKERLVLEGGPEVEPEGINRLFAAAKAVIDTVLAPLIIGGIAEDASKDTRFEEEIAEINQRLQDALNPVKIVTEVASNTVDNLLDGGRRNIVNDLEELDDNTFLDLSSVTDGVNRGLRESSELIAESFGNATGDIIASLGDFLMTADKELLFAENNIPEMTRANSILTGASFGASLKRLLFRKKG